MVYLGLAIFGFIAALDLNLEFLPDISVPRLIVSASYPGLPPTEVRELITIPLEDALSSIKSLKNLSSVSRDGASTIELEFHWGADMMFAAVEAREIINLAFANLPSDINKPVVLPINPGDDPVLRIGVFPRSGDLALAGRLAGREVKTRLQQVDGVGSVTVTGGIRDEIQVLVDQSKAAARGVGIEHITKALADSNLDYPAGTLTEGAVEYLVRSQGKVEDAESLGRLFVTGGNTEARFRLEEIADIRPGEKEKKSLFQMNGREGIGLIIRRKGKASPVKLSRDIRECLKELRMSYGRDLEFIIVKDSSSLIENSIRNLVFSALLGAVIAFIVLLVFTGKLSQSAILVASIPFSILSALLLLRLAGRSLNIMSLGGLALGVGMLVDNSVVVLENLSRNINSGSGDIRCLTVTYTEEMAVSTFGATLTSLVVFLPIIFLPGILGALFKDLALSVAFSLGASYIISITLVPVLFMLSLRKKRRPVGERENRQKKSILYIERLYRSLFRRSLRRPLLVALLLLTVTGFGIFALFHLKTEFMPAIDSGEIRITVTAPPGTSMGNIAMIGSGLARQIQMIDDVALTHSKAGGEEDDFYYLADPEDSGNLLHMVIQLKNLDRFGRGRMSVFEIQKILLDKLTVEGSTLNISLPEDILSPILRTGTQAPVLKIYGSSQDEALSRAAYVKGYIEDLSTADVNIVPSGRKPEIVVTPDRPAIARSGVSVLDMAQSIRAALEGTYPTRLTVGGRDVDVRVRLREEDRANLDQIRSLNILAPNGDILTLSDLAHVEIKYGLPSLIRRDRRDTALLRITRQDGQSGRLSDILSHITGSYSFAESRAGSILRQNLPRILLTFSLSLVLLYLVLGAQFQSFLLPLLLMASIPLSFSGVLLALFISGRSINLSSSLGVLVLLGITVNNSIVLFETYKRRIQKSGNVMSAIYRGSSQRLKPILMTMLTTTTALLPIAVDPSGTSTQSGMAAAIIGGLLLSTMLTLFTTPLIFSAYYRKVYSRK